MAVRHHLLALYAGSSLALVKRLAMAYTAKRTPCVAGALGLIASMRSW